MGTPVKTSEREWRDWAVIGLIILIGFMCVFLAGYWAVRFPPSWRLNADMGSNLDPNSDFLTRRPGGLVEPVDPILLTQPVWINVILTPGALFPTRIPNAAATATLFNTPTRVAPATQTTIITPSPTRTLVYDLPTSTAISNPSYTKTPVLTSTTVPSLTNTSLPTNVPTIAPPPQADLRITMNDGATHYATGISIQYVIVVSNPVGLVGVANATVTGSFSPDQLTNITWTCTAPAGASCTASGTGNIVDAVTIPIGSSVTYTVHATVISSPPPTGSLIGSASVTVPPGITDPDPGNNSATDTDHLILTDTPPIEIGTDPNNDVYELKSGQYLTLPFEITVSGHADWDMVYYELPYGGGVRLDWVIIEISDGMNWYIIFNWGDNSADAHTNMNFNSLPDPVLPPEPDERYISSDRFYPSPTGVQTGIAIDLDGIVPNGTYRFIRFYAPPGDADEQMEIDAIAVLP